MGEDTTLEKLVQTGFKPSEHGFRFANRFPGYRYDAVCGGMSFAALDYHLAGEGVPGTEEAPPEDSTLYRYLVRRLFDSFGKGMMPAKLLRWMGLPDETSNGIWKRTRDEFKEIKQRIDEGGLVPLVLLYKTVKESSDPGVNPQVAPLHSRIKALVKALMLNHQVLAYGCTQMPGGSYDVHIYDPNFPGDDSCVIRAEVCRLGDTLGMKSVQHHSKGTRSVHGFFINRHYKQRAPPKNL